MFKRIIRITKSKRIVLIILLFSNIISFLELFAAKALVSLFAVIENGFFELKDLFVWFDDDYFKLDIVEFILCISLFFFLKNVIILFLKWFQVKFIYLKQRQLSMSILDKISNLSYELFLLKSRESYLNTFSNDVGQVCNSGLSSVLTIFSEGLIISVLVFSLCLQFPLYSTYALVCLFCLLIVFSYLISVFSKKLGTKRHRLEILNFGIITSFLNSFREVKMYRMVNKIKFDYESAKVQSDSVGSMNSWLQLMNKYYIEVAFLISILCVVSGLNIDPTELKNFLLFYIYIGVKIIPSVSSIIVGFTNLKYAEASLIHMESLLALDEEGNSFLKMKFFEEKNVLIKLEDVSFKYKTSERNIIKNFTCKIETDKKYLIRGESGKGKSTLLDLISGFLKPTSGEVYFNGSLNTDSISYCSQNPYIFKQSILFNVTLDIDDPDLRRFHDVIRICCLEDFVNRQSDGYNTLLESGGSNLSGGELKRIALARSLYKESHVLVLDEVTNGIDDKNKRSILNNLVQLKLTIIFVSHDNDVVHYVDNIIDLS